MNSARYKSTGPTGADHRADTLSPCLRLYAYSQEWDDERLARELGGSSANLPALFGAIECLTLAPEREPTYWRRRVGRIAELTGFDSARLEDILRAALTAPPVEFDAAPQEPACGGHASMSVVRATLMGRPLTSCPACGHLYDVAADRASRAHG
jgi:hypothetical protein